MSARKILSRNAKIIAKNNQDQMFRQKSIRTVVDKSVLQVMSQPSSMLRLAMTSLPSQQLRNIRKFAAFRNVVYLTDVQYQNFFNFFVIHKNPHNNKFIDQSYSKQQDYQLYVNPQILKFEGQTYPVTQYCLSFPFFKSTADRYNKIKIKYSKIDNIDILTKKQYIKHHDVVEQLQGFRSQLFQHCMDHIQGKHFLTPSVSKGRLGFQEVSDQYKTTKFLVKQFNVRIKQAMDKGQLKSKDFQKIQADYKNRIVQQYSKQSVQAKQFVQKLGENGHPFLNKKT